MKDGKRYAVVLEGEENASSFFIVLKRSGFLFLYMIKKDSKSAVRYYAVYFVEWFLFPAERGLTESKVLKPPLNR